MNETDAQRRDRFAALAADRGIVIAELVQTLRNIATELDLIAAAYPADSATAAALLNLTGQARTSIERGKKA